MSTEPERFLTIQQAADLTSYDEATVIKWLAIGLPHCTRIPGQNRPRHKDIRIRASDLWIWMDSIMISRVPSPSPSREKVRLARQDDSEGLGAWRKVKRAK